MPLHPSRRTLLSAALAAGVAPAWVACSHLGDKAHHTFALGVASGWPRPNSVVLWTRLTAAEPLSAPVPVPVPVQWELAEDEAFTRIVQRGVETTDASVAHSVHAEVHGLAPARWYWYRFSALGQRSATGRTRTAPAADSIAPLKFSIASCQRWDHGHYAAWRHLADESPDLIVFLGDYIYEHPSLPSAVRTHEGVVGTRTLAQYRARYAQYKSDAHLQRAHASAPWLVTWDDHEVENDYAGLHAIGPSLRDFAARRTAAYQAWWEHMPVPHSLRPRGPDLPLYGHCDWGALARFHLMDDRQYRDPQACLLPTALSAATVTAAACPALTHPARTMLGEAQERWLAQGLARNDTRWNLLAQQTLMAPFSWAPEGLYWTDGWSGYPAARTRLLQTLHQARTLNPVVLGGDVHAHYVADLHTHINGPLVATEFCGTSISSRGMDQARIDAALPLNPHIHHARSSERGYISFTLQPGRLDARLQVISDGADVAATVRTSARYAVEAGRAGAQS